jgi:hypothetical protein
MIFYPSTRYTRSGNNIVAAVIILLMNVLRLVDKVFLPNIAYAHCDVPCGIYDPASAQTAAKTTQRLDKDKEGKTDFWKMGETLNMPSTSLRQYEITFLSSGKAFSNARRLQV